VLLLDRDCPEANLRIFEEHVRPWKILHVEDQLSDHCPRGGTWERLLTIARLVTSDYVIQVDSDTVTNGPVPEVVDCVDRGCSFMIGTWQAQEIEAAAASAERVKGSDSQHVQILGERHLTALDDSSNLRYARGQSSFAGFAKGSFSLPMLETFSDRMRALLGEEKWSQWGSESFASNFCVANADKACVLPWPKYASYNPDRDVDFGGSVFLHFEGTNRFKTGAYLKCGRAVINDLRRGSSAFRQ
jgi:hypothetical protein